MILTRLSYGERRVKNNTIMERRISKKKMPAVALRNLAVLPGMIIHFDLNRSVSIKGVEQAMMKDQKLFCVAQKDPSCDNPQEAELHEIGTIVEIKQLLKLPNNVVRVLVEGIDRAKLFSLAEADDFLLATVGELRPDDDVTIPITTDTALLDPNSMSDEEIEASHARLKELTAMVNMLRELLNSYLEYHPKMSKVLYKQFEDASTLSQLLDSVAINLQMNYPDRQLLLETVSVSERFMALVTIMSREVDVLNIKKDIAAKIKKRVDQNQREYVLREQMRLIREELGETSTLADDEESYRKKTQELCAPQEVKDKILREIDRLGKMHDNSSDAAVCRGYIETLLELPWDKSSEDSYDIQKAEYILNRDHYGLDKVKERMLEFLAVRSLTNKADTPIICLVGPPGVGKTSIAKSVAEALDKKYVRICLGGVRDEAEIRGHRRTYVGAMPGRIAAAIKSAGVNNPLMLLDEIDKMSSDYRGDTASALLEVLDGEQNGRFVDHYVEIPMDLSNVLFIATANSMADIPKPLLDRMEVIEVSSYTENEKMHIAKEHLLTKTIRKNGLPSRSITINDAALRQIIRGYTAEAGVRNLERKLGEICRKAARKIISDGDRCVRITMKNLEEYLGKPKHHYDKANKSDEIGIVRGLAWTSAGGDTLSIEVNMMPGKGEIQLTGQLGDVMKESALTGISFIRSIAKKEGILPEVFEKNDFHMHIPQGSVPKDGPSAGITMATAIYSVVSGRKVRANLAMTGEITLRGRVLPIGGLKEKLLAAKNAGIVTVLVPKDNEPDVAELSEEITQGLQIVFVSNMNQVLMHAIV